MSRHIRVGISDDSPGNVATVAASGRQDDGRFERVESIGAVMRVQMRTGLENIWMAARLQLS